MVGPHEVTSSLVGSCEVRGIPNRDSPHLAGFHRAADAPVLCPTPFTPQWSG